MFDIWLGLGAIVLSILAFVTKDDGVRANCLGAIFAGGIWLTVYGILTTFVE